MAWDLAGSSVSAVSAIFFGCASKEGVYEYIEETSKMLGRHTELNEPDLDVGGTENFYMAALQQINAGAASSSGQAVTIPTSQGPTSSGKSRIEDAAKEEAGAGNLDEETCLTLCNLYLTLTIYI